MEAKAPGLRSAEPPPRLVGDSFSSTSDSPSYSVVITADVRTLTTFLFKAKER